MSFWATTSQFWRDDLESHFKGFGLVLDTFVNNHAHEHRDILFLTANDGAPVLAKEPIGCNSEYRYWEGLHDFSAANFSGVRISYQHGRVSVFVDPRGTEAWTECFRDAVIAPGEGWTQATGGMYLGLSAKTGDLADNHDVLSFVVTPEDEPAPVSGMDDAPAQVHRGGGGTTTVCDISVVASTRLTPPYDAVHDGR